MTEATAASSSSLRSTRVVEEEQPSKKNISESPVPVGKLSPPPQSSPTPRLQTTSCSATNTNAGTVVGFKRERERMPIPRFFYCLDNCSIISF
mmetsp:Transcript_7030/g.17326  ORF Transcript_7030/g.17326 Transcript_7030/m.17326 type:complete len:93 (+) Transcript_7030:868-1146(+)